MLAFQSPELKLIVSYADSGQGHNGGIYQASNWVYTESKQHHVFIIKGKPIHPRTIGAIYGHGSQRIDWLRRNLDPEAQRIMTAEKHRYLYPLNRKMRRQIEPLAKPYPKRGRGEIDNASHTNEKTGGASLTRPLNNLETNNA